MLVVTLVGGMDGQDIRANGNLESTQGSQASAAEVEPPSAPQPMSSWQYGGFVDVGYLSDFNDPPNHLFRSRGTTFHVDEFDVNIAAVYLKKGEAPQPPEALRAGIIRLTDLTRQAVFLFEVAVH